VSPVYYEERDGHWRRLLLLLLPPLYHDDGPVNKHRIRIATLGRWGF
jgi:hypothetical protein